MSRERAEAKTLILHWFDAGDPTDKQRAIMSRDIDRFFAEIELRSDWWECMSTLLDDGGKVSFSLNGVTWRAAPSAKGLVVTSIVPGWNFGWRRILTDEISYDVLTWLGHYLRQYVHRSNIARVLMAVHEREGIVLHPFGSGVMMQRYSDIAPAPERKQIFANAQQLAEDQWGICERAAAPYRSAWVRRNTLDPAIHQAIFHYLRGENLLIAGFELEALSAYDCVLQSLQGMGWEWAPGEARRDRGDLIRAMGMGRGSQQCAELAYSIRNQFVAHAGGWRWWDAGEFLDDELVGKIRSTASRALRKAADLEVTHRRIESYPKNWSAWLLTHFPILWSAVWFRDLVRS